MSFIVKALGVGTLPGTGSFDLYAVPDPKSAMVTSVRVVNDGASDATVSLFVRQSGGAVPRLIARPKIEIGPGGIFVMDNLVTLGKGDAIHMTVSGAAPNVGYLVSGMERD